MIKKQYKRMALVLHPDKYHSVAAEGAFKLIQSAFQVLTVPEKRQSYDSSLSSKKRPHQSPHTPSGSSKCSKSSRPTGEEAKSRQSQPQAAADHKARTSSTGFGITNTKENCRGGCNLRNVRFKIVHQANGTKKIVVSCNDKVVEFQHVWLLIGF
ncbi:hypothetical protein Patl1_21273 [Pistacia atlantica]|uniref:Uncharacterized protein n=1 Tax=Pistacia atlantica TaxID=434234 RepID=A0ACC1BIE9_9ROSI|nr:hypothetical protein Patl1_21273 [Pistacia atlantica]